jgi:hypothetical protein
MIKKLNMFAILALLATTVLAFSACTKEEAKEAPAAITATGGVAPVAAATTGGAAPAAAPAAPAAAAPAAPAGK